jgi:hypothetical protein
MLALCMVWSGSMRDCSFCRHGCQPSFAEGFFRPSLSIGGHWQALPTLRVVENHGCRVYTVPGRDARSPGYCNVTMHIEYC